VCSSDRGRLAVTDAALTLTVVAPMHNEEENVRAFLDDVEGALAGTLPFELLAVDDGSTDETLARLTAELPSRPWLRVIQLSGRRPRADGRGPPSAAGGPAGGGGGGNWWPAGCQGAGGR